MSENIVPNYAINFHELSLKESTFVLDDVEQYLCVNKFLNHDKSVKYFNKRITAEGFEINQENLLMVIISDWVKINYMII